MIFYYCYRILPLPISRLVHKHPRRPKRREHHLQKTEVAQSSERYHLGQKKSSGRPFRSTIHDVSYCRPADAALRHDHKTICVHEYFPRIL